MTQLRRYLAVLCLAGGIWSYPAMGQESGGVFDPVTMDPPSSDPSSPAKWEDLTFQSRGSRITAILYVAAGQELHPTVVLLHGFPGSEGNQDIGQALRRAGANVLFFHFRGSWGMEGKFSFANAQEDIEAALEFLRDPENQAKYLVDPNRLTLIGFSMGAWLALLVGARDPAVACVGSLDMGNMALNGQLGISASKLAGGFEQRVGPGTPINGNALALAEELIAHAKDWDPSSHAEALRERPILLLSTEGNPGHDLLLTALRDVSADRVTEIIWQTDHLFSDRRIALSHAVVDWFRTSCDP